MLAFESFQTWPSFWLVEIESISKLYITVNRAQLMGFASTIVDIENIVRKEENACFHRFSKSLL